MAEQENILTRLGKLFQNQIVVRKTPTGQLKVKDVDLSQQALTSNFIDRYTRLMNNQHSKQGWGTKYANLANKQNAFEIARNELFVYIYLNSKTEAMAGYNDDLVMSFAIALWVRDTALRIQKDKSQTQWMMMDSILKNNGNKPEHAAGFQKGNPDHPNKNPYEMDTGKDKEDLTWLLG